MTRRAVDWFRDKAIRKVVRFGVPAAIGKVASSLAGLVTMALLARQLGPESFGVVAMIRTVVGIVDSYANFNTWQAIIRYGTEAIAQKRIGDVERVIKLGVVIDLATGVLGTVILAVVAFIVPAAFGWSQHEAAFCALYGATIFTRVSGASDGVFRICDSYRAQAISSTVSAVIVAVAVGIAVGLDASFDGCVLALIIGEVLGNLIVTVTSLLVARDAGFGSWRKASLKGIGTAFPGIVRFLVTTNAQLTVKKTSSELDMVIVGALLGKAASGLFRVVKQLGTIPGRVFMPFEQVLFTELARATASRDYAMFRRLLWRFTGIVTAGSLLMWAVAAIAAEPLIRIVAGNDYVSAASAFRWYLLAMVLIIAGTPTMRAIIALGRPGTLFGIDVVVLVVLAASLIAGSLLWGLTGVAAAVVVHRFVQLVWSMLVVQRALRSEERAVAAS
jgi:O-antigen/teichoic acid export membrane protein